MKFSTHPAQTAAVCATMLFALSSATMTSAEVREPAAGPTVSFEAAFAPESSQNLEIVSQGPEVVQQPAERPEPEPDLPAARSLASLAARQPQPAELGRELHCLAGAIYFEAKSESLAGQLAVGRVVVARSKSGVFPGSYCGVVFQRSQFSFIRGGMPAMNRSSQQWRNAVAIAQIAHAGSWQSPVEGALFFHAARVSPAWRRTRIAQIENHVFYR